MIIISGVVINGGWSYWSSWTMCSSNNGLCGSGSQSRYRLCNSPPPSGGGTYCMNGETLTWQDCNVPCKGTSHAYAVMILVLEYTVLLGMVDHSL